MSAYQVYAKTFWHPQVILTYMYVMEYHTIPKLKLWFQEWIKWRNTLWNLSWECDKGNTLHKPASVWAQGEQQQPGWIFICQDWYTDVIGMVPVAGSVSSLMLHSDIIRISNEKNDIALCNQKKVASFDEKFIMTQHFCRADCGEQLRRM